MELIETAKNFISENKDLLSIITTIAMAIFAFLQYRINKRQEVHQRTTTSVDYCKQLSEFFDESSLDWKSKQDNIFCEMKDAFENAVKEQSPHISEDEQRRIRLLLGERNAWDASVAICKYLDLTGTEFQIFLNRLHSYELSCWGHSNYLLQALREVKLDLLDFHQRLILQKKVKSLIPVWSYGLYCFKSEMESVEKELSIKDGWLDSMKKDCDQLYNVIKILEDKSSIMTDVFNEEFSAKEKDSMKKFFAEKNWNDHM